MRMDVADYVLVKEEGVLKKLLYWTLAIFKI